MARVFITGRGLITPLGRGLAENEAALRSGKSGIVFCPEFADRNLDSKVAGISNEKLDSPLLDRKMLRFSPPVAVMSVVAVAEALQEAGLNPQELHGARIAIIGGVANGNGKESFESVKNYLDTGKLRAVSPFIVPRVMPSSAVAILSLVFGFTGENYDISAACASSTQSLMIGSRMIQAGLYDIVLAGGAEQLDWVQALGFNAMRALSTRYSDDPARSSRPFDVDRDGFVLASGAAWTVLESEASMLRRKARPITLISGVSGNSNATDMVVPDARSSCEVMEMAIADAGLKPSDIGYVNTHGTSTPVGDPVEMEAIRTVFGDHAGKVAINSTKSQTGHMVGATGAAEIIFSSLMLEKHFISPSINLDNPEPAFHWADLVKSCRTGVNIKHALSNSFAFGGSNACVVLTNCD